jgi:hypothetical protein
VARNTIQKWGGGGPMTTIWVQGVQDVKGFFHLRPYSKIPKYGEYRYKCVNIKIGKPPDVRDIPDTTKQPKSNVPRFSVLTDSNNIISSNCHRAWLIAPFLLIFTLFTVSNESVLFNLSTFPTFYTKKERERV